MGSTYSDILDTAQALRTNPGALHDHLWCSRRVFTPRFVGSLDTNVPEWRGAVGPRWPLLLAARAGDVEPWIELERLDLADDWSTPQRQRLVRWMRGAADDEAAPAALDVLQRAARGLYAQWSSHGSRRPRVAWIVRVALRWGDPEIVQAVFEYAWIHTPTLVAALQADRPDVWRFSQRVEHHHRKTPWRDAAREANLAYATTHGHSEVSWGDEVAASDSGAQGDPDAWRVTQSRRLERAMNARSEWSWSAVREVVCSEHPLRGMFMSLVWDGGTACWLDERGQPRDLSGQPLASRSLRLAHPRTLPELDAWRRRQLAPQPFEQLERRTFTPDNLLALGHGWFDPGLPGHVHTDTLMGLLRRRRWRLCVGNDNGVIPCFFRHDSFSDTTTLCQLAQPLFSRKRPSRRALSLQVVFLRGAWSHWELTNTYYLRDHVTAPTWSSGPRPEQVLSLEDVDPVTLSEVMRDLHDASLENDDPNILP